MDQSGKNAALVKSLAVIGLAVLAIVLLFAMFGGYLGFGNAFNVNGNHMVGNYYNNDGAGWYYSGNPGMMNGRYGGYFAASNNAVNLTSILAVMLKILLYVSIVGLIAGLGVFLYKNLSRATAEKVRSDIPGAAGLSNCPVCKRSISSEFAFCPICGAKVRQE